MTYLTDLAARIATKAHEGQTRWDKSVAYITHPAAVARSLIEDGMTEDWIVVAWLHDVIEDTNLTADRLITLGIPDYLAHSVEILSKKKEQSYLDYILDVSRDPIARDVKKADLRHNMSDLKPGSMYQKYELALYILEMR